MEATISEREAPISVSMLDSAVNRMYGQAPTESAIHLVEKFSNSEDAWQCSVETLPSVTCSSATKFIALKALQKYIRHNWQAIDAEQRVSIECGIQGFINLVIGNMAQSRNLSTADEAYVEILKYEWPQQRPTLFSDLIAASESSTAACINNFKIFQILSDEISENSSSSLTSQRIFEMTEAFSNNFGIIYQFIMRVFESNPDQAVASAALSAIKSFISLVNPSFIVETPLFSILCDTMLPKPSLTIEVISVFGEIAIAPQMPETFAQFIPHIFELMINSLTTYFSTTPLFTWECDSMESLAIALTNFIVRFSTILPQQEEELALSWIVEMSNPTVIKLSRICYDFWRTFTHEPRTGDYIQALRHNTIISITCPCELIEVKDDDEMVHFEVETEGDSQVIYSFMSETLSNLAAQNPSAAVETIYSCIETLSSGSESLAMVEPISHSAAVVINALGQTEAAEFGQRILSYLMSLVDSFSEYSFYPKLVSAFIFFSSQISKYLPEAALTDVIQRFIGFLSNIPGKIQILSSFYFEKVMVDCAEFMSGIQAKNGETFVDKILQSIDCLFEKFQHNAIFSILHGFSCVLSKLKNNKEAKIQALLSKVDGQTPDDLKQFNFIIHCYLSIAEGLDFSQYFIARASYFFDAMNTSQGDKALMTTIMQLFTKIIESSSNAQIASMFCEAIPGFYHSLPPESKCGQLIILFHAICSKCSSIFTQYLDGIFSDVILPSIELIKADFDENYEIREPLAKLMRAVVLNNSSYLFALPPENMHYFVMTLSWLAQHPQQEVCRLGLMALNDFADEVKEKEAYASEYSIYLCRIAFEEMSDKVHKYALSEEVHILMNLLPSSYIQQNASKLASEMAEVFPGHSQEEMAQCLSTITQSCNDFFICNTCAEDFLIQMSKRETCGPNFFSREN